MAKSLLCMLLVATLIGACGGSNEDVPVVLPFPNTAALENFVMKPSGSKSWTLTGTRTAQNGTTTTVEEYTATLTISPG